MSEWRIERDDGYQPYYWVMRENQSIARCDTKKTAEQVVRDHNARAELRGAVEAALELLTWSGMHSNPTLKWERLKEAIATLKAALAADRPPQPEPGQGEK